MKIEDVPKAKRLFDQREEVLIKRSSMRLAAAFDLKGVPVDWCVRTYRGTSNMQDVDDKLFADVRQALETYYDEQLSRLYSELTALGVTDFGGVDAVEAAANG